MHLRVQVPVEARDIGSPGLKLQVLASYLIWVLLTLQPFLQLQYKRHLKIFFLNIKGTLGLSVQKIFAGIGRDLHPLSLPFVTVF